LRVRVGMGYYTYDLRLTTYDLLLWSYL